MLVKKGVADLNLVSVVFPLEEIRVCLGTRSTRGSVISTEP